jgi:ATP-dependent Clp protease adaptor protein ClpS
MPGAKRLIPTRPDTEKKKEKGKKGAGLSSSGSVLLPLAFSLFPSSATNPGTETSPDIDVEEKLKDAFTRGWSVIVWNDPINLMDYVVYVFKSVLKMNEQDASRHMWEVHQKGKSVVARETREKSELIVHRLRGFGLNATLEKA